MRSFRFAQFFLLGLGLMLASAGTASAGQFKILYSFCKQASCADGSSPYNVALGRSGNLFGTTFQAQTFLQGSVVYELLPAPSGRNKWHEKVLHVFCRRGGTRCQDGSAPFGQLNPDTKGNFFGETESGSGIKGIVFELSPDGSHDGFTYRVIHKFCSLPHCADGHRGGDVMAIDEAGNVYGTAYEGGAHRKGVVYELSPVPDKKGWTEKVLYDFCTERKCVDGDEPVNGVTYAGAATGVPYDGRSPLYGVTTRGGNGNGIAFSLTPQGDGSWKEKVIFAFCKERPHCTSGSAPVNAGPLAIDSSGNIYGATASGGTEGDGLVYELHPAAKKWSETVLYNFCFDQGCDGSFPNSNPILDAAGNLYGTSSVSIYKITLGDSQPQLGFVHRFCSQPHCVDGQSPVGGLVMDAAGDLYGVTTAGGAYNNGTVFRFTP